MLDWDNFEFVQSESVLPWFPVKDVLNDGRSIEEILEKYDHMYLTLLNVLTSEAANNNQHYAPMGTDDFPEKVWETPCKKNSLPLIRLAAGGQVRDFRANPAVNIKVFTAKPAENFMNYNNHFWYRVGDGFVEAEFFALISPETDQSKLGKVR